MQLIVEFPVDAEEYAAQGLAQNVSPPEACPHCQARATLEALGYYQRNVTGGKSTVLRLSIRRFRCQACGKTVSILPAFAQPYRLIHNRAIHRFFCGQKSGADVTPWRALLRRYWQKFGSWFSRVDAVLRRPFDHVPHPRSPERWWEAVVASYGDMAAATRLLVTEFQTTLFGRYRCHRPNTPCP